MTTQEIVSVEALDRTTCWSLVDQPSVGRVAMLHRSGRPVVRTSGQRLVTSES